MCRTESILFRLVPCGLVIGRVDIKSIFDAVDVSTFAAVPAEGVLDFTPLPDASGS
jgi:hypothetical protein